MTDDSKPQNANGSNDESVKPSEMFSAFAAAAVKWTGAPTPDPEVSVSFSLGWHVAQAHAWALTGKEPQDDLGLEADLRWAVLDGQIKAGREQLTKDANVDSGGSQAAGEPEAGDSAAAGGDPPQADAESDGSQASEELQLGDRPPEGGDAEQAKQIKSLRDNLLRDLYIADSVLGKAFLLGLELHALCVGPADAVGDAGAKDGEVEKALKDRAQVDRLLRDLASKLPPNAGHGVMNSLSLWDAQVNPRPQPPPKSGGIDTSLRQQGFIWYAMLAGEVAAKDLLRLSDYVGTGEEMIKRLGDLARRALNSRAAWLLGGVVLLLVALGLFLIFGSDQGGHVAAGLTSLIAAFGITWKGIGGFFGRAAAKGEQALWDAQIDWTIAYRCTVPLVEPGDGDPKRNRRNDHFDTWKGWLQRWPSLGDADAGESAADRAGAGLDRPRINVLPELVGAGAPPRGQLRDLGEFGLPTPNEQPQNSRERYIVAHSMGCRVTLEVLRRARAYSAGGAYPGRVFEAFPPRQLVSADPVVPRGVFAAATRLRRARLVFAQRLGAPPSLSRRSASPGRRARARNRSDRSADAQVEQQIADSVGAQRVLG